MVEHRPLERLQLDPGLDPELVHECRARGTVRRKCVGLAPRAVEGKHLLRPEALAVGMLFYEHVELGHDLGMTSPGEVGLDPLLERAQAELLESAGRCRGERLAVQIGQRRPTPERERLARPPLGPQLCELVEVAGAGRNVEHVPRRARS